VTNVELVARYGLLGRASTKPPTLLRNEKWDALRSDLGIGQEDKIEKIFLIC
jgi:hypothetical protein